MSGFGYKDNTCERDQFIVVLCVDSKCTEF